MKATTQESRTSFAIIVPAYNEERDIARCLSAIRRAQRSANLTSLAIHVIDDCSTDGTATIAARCGATVHSMSQKVSIAALRNYGARESESDVLLFLDADMEASADWLQVTREYFDQDRADVVGFVERIPPQAPWLAKIWSARVLAHRTNVAEVDYLPGKNIACRRVFFDRVGGFDDTLITSEDKDFVMRLKKAGARVISDPSVEIVHWGYERSLTELVRKEFWRQSNNLNLIQRHGGSWRLLRLPVVSAAHVCWGMLVAGVALSGRFSWTLFTLYAWFMPSLVTTLAHRLSRRSWRTILQFTFLYWLRYNVAGAAAIYEFTRRRGIERSTQQD